MKYSEGKWKVKEESASGGTMFGSDKQYVGELYSEGDLIGQATEEQKQGNMAIVLNSVPMYELLKRITKRAVNSNSLGKTELAQIRHIVKKIEKQAEYL